ncbi:glycosyltransferase [Cuniculiplasma sp. SKW3]|uniref:glycosyltransferase n=1 Tax=unclassified Cuniculiplasma TaxID=2619706 RepID=UPI003FD6B43F
MRLDFFLLILVGTLSSTISILYYTMNTYLSRRKAKLREENSVRGEQLTKDDVTAVIPVYNENPELFSISLRSISSQVHHTIVISDGIEEPYSSICEASGAEFILKEQRSGKRSSLAMGMEKVKTKIVIFMDADALPEEDAVEKILKEYDPETGGVGSNIFMDTSDGKMVSYASEFLERSKETVQRAMSRFGNIMIIDGSFASYRSEVIRDYVQSDEFRNYRIKGKIPYYGGGDDTSLTAFVIRSGYRVRKAFDARVVTFPKKNIKSFAKQNLRWSRTAWRTFFQNIRNGTFKRSNKFYVLEQFLTFSIPVLFLGVLLFRGITFLDIFVHRGFIFPNPFLFITHGLTHAVTNPYYSTYMITSTGSTLSSFLFLTTVAENSVKERLKIIGYGSIGALILFLTSVYAMFTFRRA